MACLEVKQIFLHALPQVERENKTDESWKTNKQKKDKLTNSGDDTGKTRKECAECARVSKFVSLNSLFDEFLCSVGQSDHICSPGQ